MGIATLVVVWLLLWACQAFLDINFASLTTALPVTVSPFLVSFYTTSLNDSLARFAQRRVPALKAWFSLGVHAGTGMLVLGTLLLLVNLYSFVAPVQASGEPLLTPMIPGISLPWSQLGYVAFALLINGVLHEAGHALAAAAEAVPVNGVGAMLWFPFLPAFHVTVAETIRERPAMAQLRVYCAGAWHNAVLALAALALLALLPVLLAPGYVHADGAVVTDLPADADGRPSVMTGALRPGDVIVALDQCAVATVADWRLCILSVWQQLQARPGYCVDASVVSAAVQQHPMAQACCQGADLQSDGGAAAQECVGSDGTRHTCWSYVSRQQGVRRVTALVPNDAVSSSYCAGHGDCDSGAVCVRPLPESQADVYLRVTTASGEAWLFVGPPSQLFSAVTLGQYRQRWPALSLLLPLSLPDALWRLLYYTSTIAQALGPLNMVPTHWLDGAVAFPPLLAYYAPSYDAHRLARISKVTITAGSALLAANLSVYLVRGLIWMFVSATAS